MRINLQSDLHLEFDKKSLYQPKYLGEDVLVLAGDIQVGLHRDKWFMDLLKHRHIVYVFGNHEYYGHQNFYALNTRAKVWADRINKVAGEMGYVHKLYILQNESVVINDTLFIGATLWTNYNNADNAVMEIAPRLINDHAQINGRSFQPITVQELLFEHKRSVSYIMRQLMSNSLGNKLKTVVVTHHLPSKQSVHERYLSGESLWAEQMNYLFYSDLEEIVKHANVWLHGHTHDSAEYTVGDTIVRCNPRGYPRRGEFENPNFKEFIIEV